MTRREASWYLSLCIILGLVGPLVIRGCADVRPPPPPPPPVAPAPITPDDPPAPPPADDAPLRERLAYFESRAIVLTGAVGRANADLQAVRDEAKRLRQEASLAPLRTALTWCTWAGGIVMVLGGVLALLLGLLTAQFPILARIPFGWKTAAFISACGLAAVILAQGLGSILPHAGLIGIGVMVLLILAALIYVAATWRRAGRAAATEWREYANAVPTHLRNQLDSYSKVRQGATAPLVDKLLEVR